MFRFIHSSDLHIGKRFGNFPEDLRGRLREARHGVITRIAEQARTNRAPYILLAGDTFDTETPTPQMLQHAFQEMGQWGDLTWVILPGNHDSLQADELWRRARAVAPPNVLLALEASPLPLGKDVMILPAPCTTRRPGRDLTEWMSETMTPEGILRIGLAHGPVLDFSEDGAKGDVIAPNRSELAQLDYLALGDWHGGMNLNPRTFYSGSPEPDRFKHNRPGEALLVSIDAVGAMPAVSPVPTALFDWQTRMLELIGSEADETALQALLPPPGSRRQTLLRLQLLGTARIGARTALSARLDESAPQFAHFEFDDTQLMTECETADLERIDHAGALRLAAEALMAESMDMALSEEDRGIAEAALMRLFTYCEAVDA